MEKKLTKRDYFNELKGLVGNREDLITFIDHELELLDKKSSSSKETKTQIENKGIMETIYNILVEKNIAMSIVDIQNANPEIKGLSNQKVSALLKKLVDTGKVERIVEGKKTSFKAI